MSLPPNAETHMRALRDCRIEIDRLNGELRAAREADDAHRITAIERELESTNRQLREARAFLDLSMIPPEARIMVSHYYGMVATDLSNRAEVAELNAYLPRQQEPRSQQALEYLFQLWEQLRELGVEVLPVGPLAATSDPAELRAGADLFGRLAIAASRG